MPKSTTPRTPICSQVFWRENRDCTRSTLPVGTNWAARMPAMVKTNNGVTSGAGSQLVKIRPMTCSAFETLEALKKTQANETY